MKENDDKVKSAMEELKNVLKGNFNCEIVSGGYTDKKNIGFEWNL